jgi:ArsR family transcriptional regulator, virulence genes transcriptional regulator
MKDIEKKSEEVAELLKFLSHPKRFLLLCKLRDGAKTVWELEKSCNVSQSQLSQFLAAMREDGILHADKQGQFVSYSIADTRILELMNEMQRIFCK